MNPSNGIFMTSLIERCRRHGPLGDLDDFLHPLFTGYLFFLPVSEHLHTTDAYLVAELLIGEVIFFHVFIKLFIHGCKSNVLSNLRQVESYLLRRYLISRYFWKLCR